MAAMHASATKLAAIAVISAFGAALTIFRWAFQTGDSPSDDGPRALIAEFSGYWIGWFLVLLSFTSMESRMQWTLRGAAAATILTGLGLSAYFANTTEVPETPAEEPTGFKSNATDLHL